MKIFGLTKEQAQVLYRLLREMRVVDFRFHGLQIGEMIVLNNIFNELHDELERREFLPKVYGK